MKKKATFEISYANLWRPNDSEQLATGTGIISVSLDGIPKIVVRKEV